MDGSLTANDLIARLRFHVGQRVIEWVGDSKDDAEIAEVEIIIAKDGMVITDTGNGYDPLTGAGVPRDRKPYRGIRSLTDDDRRKAVNLLGGTETAAEKPEKPKKR